MTLDEAREFFDFLQGGPAPDGFVLRGLPRLPRRTAFTVLYVLQEKYHLVPDTFELCATCHQLFDTMESGETVEKTGKQYCSDECLPPQREMRRAEPQEVSR